MPTAETNIKLNHITSNGASATKQTLRFSVKSMSKGYSFPNRKVERQIVRHRKVMPNLCRLQMFTAKEVEGNVNV